MTELNRTIIGDCRDLMRQLIADDVRVQMCVTSPPYWGLRDYGVSGQLGLEPTMQEYVDSMVVVFRLVRDLLAEDGTLWLNLGDCYAGSWGAQSRDQAGKHAPNVSALSANQIKAAQIRESGTGSISRTPGLKPKDLVMMPARVALALQADGWWVRQDIIWHKLNPMPESVIDRCTKAHEYIFLLSKSKTYYYNSEAILEPALADVEWKSRHRRSVWSVATQPYSGHHFAVFPPALIEPCILAGSRVGDIVFDPFIGSGTTGEVAQRLGRRWLGCELNPEYVKLERKRTAQQAMVLPVPAD